MPDSVNNLSFDVAVIGAGPGGYVAAIALAQRGASVALIERRDVGGTCLNRGCIPTKALLHAAEVYSSARDAGRFGVCLEGVGLDFGAMIARRDEVVARLRGGVESLLSSNKVTLLRGEGRLTRAGEVAFTPSDGASETIIARRVILATGSVPARPPIPGLDLPGVVTSDDLLEGVRPMPRELVIIGGGVIGVELACAYAALGVRVTIVEALDRILATSEREVSQSLALSLKKRGVAICTSCKVSEIRRENSGLLSVCYTKGDNSGVVSGDTVLVAIGRKPENGAASDLLPLERGRIVVNDRFETALPGVFAIGDVSSPVQLAHVASSQALTVANEICCDIFGSSRGAVPDLTVIPSCIYTTPEVASVGLTEDEARSRGIAVRVGKYPMMGNGKTVIVGGERGFIKVVADEASGVLLGATLLCERATDMVGELTSAIVNRLTVEDLLRAIRPHPTFAEGIGEALELTRGSSIHTPPPRR